MNDFLSSGVPQVPKQVKSKQVEKARSKSENQVANVKRDQTLYNQIEVKDNNQRPSSKDQMKNVLTGNTIDPAKQNEETTKQVRERKRKRNGSMDGQN